MNPLLARMLIALGLFAAGAGLGWHFGGLEAEADKAQILREQAERAADVADKARLASELVRQSEQQKAATLHSIAVTYEKEKTNAASDAYNDALAAVRAGELRDFWACSVPGSTEAAAAARRADEVARLRAESAGRALRAVSECESQVRGLQAVLIAERE